MRKRSLAVVFLLCACSFNGHNPVSTANIAVSRQDRLSAVDAFSKALRDTTLPPEKRANVLFQLGLLRQEQGEDSTGAEKSRHMREAIRWYEQALAISPNDGGTLNNLARAWAAVGDPRAEGIFQRLIERKREDDQNLAVYLFNYGSFLEAQGNTARAVEMRNRAAEADVGDADAQLEILRLYLPRGSSDAAQYLRHVLDLGYASSAYDYIVDTAQVSSRTPADRDHFLILLTDSLAGQSYDPGAFLNSIRGKRLMALENDDNLRPGVTELVSLHSGRHLSPETFQWWVDPSNTERRQALIRLASHIGTWYVQHNNLPRATEYLDLAFDLPGSQPPPPSLLQTLAELYGAQGRTDDLNRLAARCEQYLTGAKPEDAYAVRREIGMSLASTGHWGDGFSADSAVYQLARTTDIALGFNDRNRSTGNEERLPVDTALVTTLDTGWRFNGSPTRAVEIRLAAAQDLLRDHAVADARDILHSVPDDDFTSAFVVNPATTRQFESVIKEFGAEVAERQWPRSYAFVFPAPIQQEPWRKPVQRIADSTPTRMFSQNE